VATGASIRKMADGRMHITAIKKGGEIILDNSQAFEGGSISEIAPVTRLELTEHTYAKGGEPIKLYEGAVMGDEVIRFSEPAYDLTIENGTILESSANYAKVRGSGNVILSGTKYIHTTRVLGKGESTATTKTYQVKDAYLVNPLNSSSTLDRLYTYARCNRIIIQDVFIEDERPGDMVSVIDPHTGKLEPAAIQSLDVTFSKSLRAYAKFLVEYVPQGISTGYQNRVLITKSGSFTVPTGVTEIGVVLIGGGTGGHSGHPGKDGTSGWSSTPYGGEGGEGSEGGSGGRVLQLTLQVNPGDVIAATIGTGGTGAVFGVGGEEGNEGSATTFNGYSSDDGSVMKYGYIDLYSGDVYAIDGIAGIDGADGGHGGNNGDGGAGGNVGTAIGGSGGTRYKSSIGYAGGGGGGGAAYGKNGSAGTDGKYKPITFTGGSGGDGATPVKAATGAVPGQGGQGGHGGGGGGGGGGVNNSEYGSDGEWGGSAGSGGNGGAGGNGAAGCVIIYY